MTWINSLHGTTIPAPSGLQVETRTVSVFQMHRPQCQAAILSWEISWDFKPSKVMGCRKDRWSTILIGSCWWLLVVGTPLTSTWAPIIWGVTGVLEALWGIPVNLGSLCPTSQPSHGKTSSKKTRGAMSWPRISAEIGTGQFQAWSHFHQRIRVKKTRNVTSFSILLGEERDS